MDGRLAWLILAAQAKGPNFGTTRSAVLSPSGDRLYVATQQFEIVVADDGQWSVESFPQGVDVISTETWNVITRFDIPASQVSLSPSGRFLLAIGVTISDTLSTTSDVSEGAFIIRTDTLESVGHVDTPGEWYPDIQFSTDSRYVYLGWFGGGPIKIVELESGLVLDRVANPNQLRCSEKPRCCRLPFGVSQSGNRTRSFHLLIEQKAELSA